MDRLNRAGLRYRRGRLFRTNEVHRILRSSTYMGLHHYNRKASKTGKAKDPSEWIAMKVPAIIEPEDFERAKAHLDKRRPSVTAARITKGAMLLTRIARCSRCGGGLSLRTGKSGQYRYYACSQAATKGGQACPGRSIRMETLDEIVLEALETRLLVPARLKALLEDLARRILERQSDSQGRDKALARELRQVEQAIERLFKAVGDGLVQDGDLLRRRLAGHTQRRDELLHLKAVNRRRRDIPPGLLSRRNLEALGRALRSRLREPNSARTARPTRAPWNGTGATTWRARFSPRFVRSSTLPGATVGLEVTRHGRSAYEKPLIGKRTRNPSISLGRKI